MLALTIGALLLALLIWYAIIQWPWLDTWPYNVLLIIPFAPLAVWMFVLSRANSDQYAQNLQQAAVRNDFWTWPSLREILLAMPVLGLVAGSFLFFGLGRELTAVGKIFIFSGLTFAVALIAMRVSRK